MNNCFVNLELEYANYHSLMGHPVNYHSLMGHPVNYSVNNQVNAKAKSYEMYISDLYEDELEISIKVIITNAFKVSCKIILG